MERAFGIGVPILTEMSEIMLSRADDDMVKVSPITFILTGEKVITVRYEEPRAIHAFVARCPESGTFFADQILIGILEGIIERIGDLLERAGYDLDLLFVKSLFYPGARQRPQRGGGQGSTRHAQRAAMRFPGGTGRSGSQG